jgi:hypothetical protein
MVANRFSIAARCAGVVSSGKFAVFVLESVLRGVPKALAPAVMVFKPVSGSKSALIPGFASSFRFLPTA